MAERLIAKVEVEKALRSPLEVVPVRYGRSAALNRLSRRAFLVVIYERGQEDFIVVTAVKVNKAGAKRYGFTRV